MTILLRVVAPLLVICLCGGGGNAFLGSFEPTIRPRVAPTPSAQSIQKDTLRTSVPPDRPLILNLPSTLSDTPVERYTLLRGPTLSGVTGRSFTWVPEGATPGTYEALLEAHHEVTPPDTLVLQMDLQS